MAAKKSESSYSHILKYTGLFGSVQAISILVNMVRTKIVAVLLGPIGVGTVSLFNSTIKFVGDATNLGVATSAVKDVAAANDEAPSPKARSVECGVRSDDSPHGGTGGASLDATCTLVRSWCFIGALFGMLVCIAFSPLLDRMTFSWGNHTLHFVLLSPVVALLTLQGGELAILKGARELMSLAKISVYGVFAALLISVPIYLVYGLHGVVPTLFLIALAQFLIAFHYSNRVKPYHLDFSRSQLRAGIGMLKLGISFVLACVMASGGDFIIRAFISHSSQVDTLGLYNAGFVISVVYANMVFSAMETDYYPRLSSIRSAGRELNELVNKQIEVSVLIVAPMLILLMFGMPLIVPLLFSREFNAVIGMSQVAAIGMIFRAFYLPLEYIALSRGDSAKYLLQEFVSAAILVVCVLVGFIAFGLLGAGIGISVSAMLEALFVFFYSKALYGYYPSLGVLKYLGVHLVLLFMAGVLIMTAAPMVYWSVGVCLILISSFISFEVISKKTKRAE